MCLFSGLSCSALAVGHVGSSGSGLWRRRCFKGVCRQRFELWTPRSLEELPVATARDALDTSEARAAPVGSLLLTDGAVVLATRERVCVNGSWLACWLPTNAWTTADAPMRLSEIREVFDDEGPVLRLVQGGKRMEDDEDVHDEYDICEIETYRELEPAPEVEIDRHMVALRDPVTGALYVVDRGALTAASAKLKIHAAAE